MSLKGVISANCPKGCEAFETEVWSFVRGDQDEALRDALLVAELNLLVCPECSAVFRPESTVVYFDPGAQWAAFIFPESYSGEEARWRQKMNEDFKALRDLMGGQKPVEFEPRLYFGAEQFRSALQADIDMEDEVQIAEHLSRGLGLRLLDIPRSWARSQDLPWRIPASSAADPRDAALEGLETLLRANELLSGYKRFLEHLQGSQGMSFS